MAKQDLTAGEDIRGDHAMFIEEKHFNEHGELDEECSSIAGPTFFRVIKNGEEQSSHGWIEEGQVIQWG